jgi:hypothetical protein
VSEEQLTCGSVGDLPIAVIESYVNDFSLITCNSQLHEMEADRLLFEDSLASTSAKVREEDVGMSVDGMYHIARELNGEAKKRISNPHDSLTDNEAVELQRGRTSLPHSQSETQIKVVERRGVTLAATSLFVL